MEKLCLNASGFLKKLKAIKPKTIGSATEPGGFPTPGARAVRRMPIADRHSSTIFYQSFPHCFV